MNFWRREEAAECELVGEEMATLVGNGILVGFAGQAALSLGLSAWVFFLTTHGNMDITHPEGSIKREIEKKRLDFVSNILMIGSDIQSTLGIAYMITTFSQAHIIDTYHLHLVFDIVSLVGVSNTAAFVCWRFCRAKIDLASDSDSDSDSKTHRPSRKSLRDRFSHPSGRYRGTFIFATLYAALIILLCIRLADWDPNKAPGRCYFSHLVTSPHASHPGDDQIYVSITGSWLIAILLASIFLGVNRRRGILILAALHFPLHLYMAITLRLANQGKFEGETKHENEWDFGQTTAVVLLGIALVELVGEGKKYYDFETFVTKHGVLPPGEDGNSSVDLRRGDEEGSPGSYLLGGVAGDERRQSPEEKRDSAGEGHDSAS
ncbi:hypothetical protein BJX99DRAFT_182819 [Aspergillus californicus]